MDKNCAFSGDVSVSVIVPVYNAENYLVRCIDSIVTQDFQNLELLLIDDGSTDSSFAICNDYAIHDDRVKVFHKENGGQGTARNYGLERALGDYIVFVDNDDYLPNAHVLSRMYEASKDFDILICSEKLYASSTHIKDYYAKLESFSDRGGGAMRSFKNWDLSRNCLVQDVQEIAFYRQ